MSVVWVPKHTAEVHTLTDLELKTREMEAYKRGWAESREWFHNFDNETKKKAGNRCSTLT